MFGLPGQTLDEALTDLQAAIDKQPSHISWYQLTIEPNTLFHRQPPDLPDHDTKTDMSSRGKSLLEKHGYTQYEVSAYSQSGKQCRHNLNYWRFADYAGIGAGAHGKITDANKQCITRTHKPRHPRDFLKFAGSPVDTKNLTVLQPEEAVFEFALNQFRLQEGFKINDFTASTGLPYTAIADHIEAAMTHGLLTMHNQQIKHTEHGWLFLDDLIAKFLPEG
jgi:oxygen-independent coproporphyrinogen-3 oxidase